MTSMPFPPRPSQPQPAANEVCLRVALGALRALAGQADGKDSADGLFLPACAYLTRARRAFRAFRVAARSEPGARPACMATRCAPAPTKDECRLLRALAAAQAGDAPLLDNYLYKLALEQNCRACLAEAVSSLAAALRHSGFEVPNLSGRLVADGRNRKQAVLF